MAENRLQWGRVSAWALYDFANSPYSTIMTTVGFPIFFLAVIAPDRTGPLYWGLLYGVSEVVAGILAPGIGAWSDEVGRRKPFLIVFALMSILGTALCSFVGAGDLALAILLFGVANIGFACANVFYNALLVDVAPPGKRDTVSGIGWGTGYLGGLTAMILCLPLYRDGVTIQNADNVTFSFLLVAGLFLVFSLPIFFMRENRREPAPSRSLGAAYARVWGTLKEIRQYKNLFRYLLANFFFNDGIHAVILFGGAFGREVLGLDMQKIFMLFLYLQVVAALGAFSLGWIADRVGSRRMLLVLIVIWLFVVVGFASVQTFPQFVAGGIVAGFLLGATQSVARAFLAKLAPANKEGEFFGFFGLCGKFASFIGPVLFGAMTSITGSMRWGALALLPLFALGLFFLFKVEDPAKK